jgi:hypothetical protein
MRIIDVTEPTDVAAILAGSYIPASAADAERCGRIAEDAVVLATTIDERERLYRLAAFYWEQA